MKKSSFVPIMVVVLLLLIIGIIYESTILYSKNKQLKECQSGDYEELPICDCDSKEELAISLVSGLYEVEGNNPDTKFELLLNDDGTFMFLDDTPSVYGRAGNYYIADNKIILNNLFIISDGMSIQINNDNSMDALVYNNGVINYTKENITLTKLEGIGRFKETIGVLFDWLSKGYYTNNNTNNNS